MPISLEFWKPQLLYPILITLLSNLGLCYLLEIVLRVPWWWHLTTMPLEWMLGKESDAWQSQKTCDHAVDEQVKKGDNRDHTCSCLFCWFYWWWWLAIIPLPSPSQASGCLVIIKLIAWCSHWKANHVFMSEWRATTKPSLTHDFVMPFIATISNPAIAAANIAIPRHRCQMHGDSQVKCLSPAPEDMQPCC